MLSIMILGSVSACLAGILAGAMFGYWKGSKDTKETIKEFQKIYVARSSKDEYATKEKD